MITVRPATEADLPEAVRLYGRLEEEMVGLHEMWPLADGLDAPIDRSFGERISSGDWFVYLGLIDSVPLGFLVGHLGSLLEQAGREQIGVIDFVFTEPEAREVGIAEAMLEAALQDLAAAGAERFDAPVLPGHRLAKNFFERAGFSARSITMHRRKR